jgi:predicted glycosyltransferase
MAKGKTGQNRKTVINTTAQWPKEKKGLNRQIVISTTPQGPMEKKDKMTNSDHADHCLSILSFFSFGHCAVLLNTAQWARE